MKSLHSITSLLLIALAVSTLLVGCASQQKAQSHIPEAEFSRYVQKYPEMGKSVRQGYLTKDAAYSLRYIAPQQKIMYEFTDKVEAKRVEINAMHIPKSEKRRLYLEYVRQNQVRYIDAANAIGRQTQQAEYTLGHSPFAR